MSWRISGSVMNESKPKLIPNYHRRSDVPFARRAPILSRRMDLIVGVSAGLLILILLAIPAVPQGKGKYHGPQYRCLAQMSQLSKAVLTYSALNRGSLPGSY